MEFVESELALLVHWMHARDSVRQKKEQGLPRPWTDDILLQSYRWCNVRRMDDRVSTELLQRWYQPGCAPDVALVAATMARLINWTESLMDVTDGNCFTLANLQSARRILQERGRRGDKVFTGAYVVPGVPGKNKIDSVCDLIEVIHKSALDIFGTSMRQTWANLREFDGLGSFLSGQIVADIAHLSAGESWPDRNTWAPLGPGSNRGINRLLGFPKDGRTSQSHFEELLQRLIVVLKLRVAEIWEDRRLQAMDIQNCLCEYDKYRRLQKQEGKVRAKYDGAGCKQSVLWA